MTLAQKIVARAAGRARVRPGEIATCAVDLAMFHDSSGPRRVAPRLEELGTEVWDPSRVVVVSDHYVPAVDPESAAILKLTRDWVRENDIAHFYDMQGICHVMLADGGHLRPGMFVCGGDSHSPNGGAFGCYIAGYGATEMTGVMVTGEIWVKVPETVLVHLAGGLAVGVSAKDVMLHLCRTLGMDNNFRVVEYAGDTVAALDWQGDADAEYAEVHIIDTAALAPQVAAPHSPANTADVDTYDGVAVDQCYIGACVGAKLSDLHMAAKVLRGREVANRTRLLIAPASTTTTAAAAADGTLEALTAAGAILLPTGCGACAGLGAGVLADGEVCMSSTNRNFQGRMGSAGARVYLGSPYTVAATAVAGRIADPREFLH